METLASLPTSGWLSVSLLLFSVGFFVGQYLFKRRGGLVHGLSHTIRWIMDVGLVRVAIYCVVSAGAEIWACCRSIATEFSRRTHPYRKSIAAQLGLVLGTALSVISIRWVIGGGRPEDVAFGLVLSAFFLMWCGYMVSRARMILLVSGFFVFLNGAFSTYSHWLPQVDGPPSYAFGGLGDDRESPAAIELPVTGEGPRPLGDDR
jgi:hypothetical protein